MLTEDAAWTSSDATSGDDGEQLQRSGNLAGTLDRVRAMLDQALAAERESLAEDPSDESRLAEMTLDSLPDDTAGAVRDLADYDWRSARGRERSTNRSSSSCVARSSTRRFAGMREALSRQDPEAMQRVRDMLSDLNQLLASHARGEDTTEQFGRVHGPAR